VKGNRVVLFRTGNTDGIEGVLFVWSMAGGPEGGCCGVLSEDALVGVGLLQP